MPTIIRPYRAEDRGALLEIAADTAFFGEPVEAFLPDRRVLLDVFASYYTDHEPGHAWVADVDGRMAGYLTGCVDSGRAERVQFRLGMAAAGRFILGQYRLGRLGLHYAWHTALAALWGEYPHPDLSSYPAHLHINVAEGYRGCGLGHRLLQACFDQMVSLGVAGIHLRTTTMNPSAVHLYDAAGFQLLARRSTSLWSHWLPGVAVENLVFGKRL